MASITKDIRGQPCFACTKGGTARVCHFVTGKGRDRFFYGCDKSTEQEKCPGTTAWQSIQVPDELKRPCLEAKGLFRDPLTKGKRLRKQDKPENVSGSDEQPILIVKKVKKVKKIRKEFLKPRKLKHKNRSDAAHWIKKDDDDYCE